MESKVNLSLNRKRTLILTCFVLVKLLLQWLFINTSYDLQRDEYLYLDQANHLAWGYLSVPPFISWISLVIHYLGNGLFWVRFFPALFGVLTLVVVWKTIEELRGNLFALVLGSTCILFSCLLRLNQLYQPNSLDVLGWTSFCLAIIKYLNSGNAKWLYVGAVVFALAFLNKYNIFFLLMGMLPAVLISKKRRYFFRKEVLFAIGLGSIILLPNLIWQVQNHFPVVHHMKVLADTQLVNVNRADFLKDQVFFFTGAFFVLVFGLYALLFYVPFDNYKLFFRTFLFTLAIFVYFRAKSYYSIGLYPVYIAFGSVFLGETLNGGWKTIFRPVLIGVPILVYVLYFNVSFSLKSPSYILSHRADYQRAGLLRWEDGKDHPLPQDFADMLGWKELALTVDSIYMQLPDHEKTLILCDNYGEAGAINYYAKHIGNSAVSFNADYINWINLDNKFVNLIRIKEAENSGNEIQTSSPFFQNAANAGSVKDVNAREFGTSIFLFKNAKVDIRPRIEKEIAKTKSE